MDIKKKKKMLREFLGWDPSDEAFLKSKGLE